MNRMSRKEWLLLSRYLDDDLSEEQRQRTENRLQADDAFKAAYEELLHTRQVLRSVRPHKVPHSYLLNEAQVRSTASRAAPQLFFQYSSAIAAVVAVLALAIQLFSPRAAAIPVAYDAAQPEMMLQEAAPVDESAATATSPIIIWNPGYAAGKGGGGGGDEQTYTAIQPTPETSTSGWGIGGGAAPESAVPLEEAAPMQDATVQGEAPTEENLQATAAPEEAANPILGVAPTQEQGEIVAESPAPQALHASRSIDLFRLNFVTIAMVAGAIAIISGIVALFLHHKKQ